MAHCRSGRVDGRRVHWLRRPGGRPRGAYRRQYRAACCCEDTRTCWTRGQCGHARGQCGLGGSYLNQVYRRDDRGVIGSNPSAHRAWASSSSIPSWTCGSTGVVSVPQSRSVTQPTRNSPPNPPDGSNLLKTPTATSPQVIGGFRAWQPTVSGSQQTPVTELNRLPKLNTRVRFPSSAPRFPHPPTSSAALSAIA